MGPMGAPLLNTYASMVPVPLVTKISNEPLSKPLQAFLMFRTLKTGCAKEMVALAKKTRESKTAVCITLLMVIE